ncbi:Gfo/Idh/MocA family protein [Bythopirellula polymerisocia]|uniref:Inositol 2-dehydrogenase n=1 Tax=Bythopirellula polymerisocia TaxID=2528003 RepID=A0A5C6D5N2_9BACT|nr:Gfo/Idh/MocA family oxidoreductase [Bythopirellula polymerisocia]TWU30209.1 Inositol 2-dehydrogenase [Bythopirellula polymerisocia]
MSKQTPRRDFLKQSAEAGVVLAAASALGGVHVFAGEQSSKVRLGIIGCGNIMLLHLQGLAERRENVLLEWLCDVDPQQIDAAARAVSGFQSTAIKQTSRYEDVLEDDQVDACIIATPHHWHAPIALRAMQAGKDVYIEKPISHVYDEGPRIIAAANKYGRVVQQGSQMRSSPVTEKAGRLLQEGILGDVKVARAWTAEKRSIEKPVPDSDPPSGVDYDRWLGPAPSRPFNPLRFHGTWRRFRDYANGEIGDDGIHDLDMATWGLGIDTLPRQITARGRRTLQGHYSEYPDNMNVAFEYPDGRLLLYECYPFTEYGLYGFDNGNVFYGTEGYMVFSRRGAFSVFLGKKQVPGPTEGKELRGQRGYAEHMANFLNAVRNRTPTQAPPEVAHRSCALVHLGDIAEQVAGRLDFDPTTERFVDSDEANSLLTKTYRAPFGLPDMA